MLPDMLITDEALAEQQRKFLEALEEIDRLYKKAQRLRQKLQVVSRAMKPKQHRSIRWALARVTVKISRVVRTIPSAR